MADSTGLSVPNSGELERYAQLAARAATGFDQLSGSSVAFINLTQVIDNSIMNVDNSINSFSSSITSYENNISNLSQTQINVAQQTSRAGDQIEKTAEKAKDASEQLKNILNVIGSYGQKAFKFGEDAFNMSNLQKSAETQLQAVLAKTGVTEGALDSLKNKASEIQMKTIYKDEVLLAGSGKMIGQMSDPRAMESMMGTMADFAAGMSGGGALDTEAMSGYAEQLGTAFGGDYESLEELGFKLTKQQKEIIKNGSEMDKALAIDEVVSSSWGGLAESMANLPQNQFVGIQNSLGEIKEAVGAQITPAFMDLFAVIENNMPMIEGLMMGFSVVLEVIINLATMLAEAAANVAGFIMDNWSFFAPVIAGLGIALLAVIGYLAILTIQQTLFNAALWACPITWIVVGIMALVGLVYAAVEAFNEFSGSSVSAVGMVGGIFATVGAYILNILIYIWNGFVELVNFLANVMNDPVAAIQIAFLNMATNVLGFIESLASGIESLLSTITGTEITLTAGITKLKGQLEAKADEIKEGTEYVELLKPKDFIDLDDAFGGGYEGFDKYFGNIEDGFKGLSGGDGLPQDPGGGQNIFPPETYGSGSNPATVKGTGAGGAVKVENEEDIDWMRQLAERDYVARIAQNTLAPNVRVEFSGPITKEADTDKVVQYMISGIQDAIAISPEGVYV